MLVNSRLLLFFLLVILGLAGLTAITVSIYPTNLIGLASGIIVFLVAGVVGYYTGRGHIQLLIDKQGNPWISILLAALSTFYFFMAIAMMLVPGGSNGILALILALILGVGAYPGLRNASKKYPK